MERRRHNPAPGFRMPQPFDSVKHDYAPLSPLAPFCRFKLKTELTVSTERAEAEIMQQWGVGPRHNYDDTIKVVNLERGNQEGVYVFTGQIGDAGIASWDQGQKWRILCMENRGLIGACLNEDHPGRGTVFEINLGTWSSTLHQWIYSSGEPVKAIDWRYGVPYPTGHATGLFEPRSSDDYGIIFEVVSLDCESPGECGS